MMATQPATLARPAPSRSNASTRTSGTALKNSVGKVANPSSRRLGSVSRRSADLAGTSVTLSPDVPVRFDVPLASHHRLIGRWAASRERAGDVMTRSAARQLIERTFDHAVLELLKPIKLAEFRVVVFGGDDTLPPAIAVVCDTVGQLDLGWIEESNVLSNTLFKQVAPSGWCAAAYKVLGETLTAVLPIFGYADLLEEMSAYYWDGETDDVGAVRAMMDLHGVDEAEIDEETLPSAMNNRRPEWMLEKTASPMKHMPKLLCDKIRHLRDLYKAVRALPAETNAWRFDFKEIIEHLPEYEDRTHLPTMTLVPSDIFARELDYVGDYGMQQGFMDIAGLCRLPDAALVDGWFASLKLGVDFLIAAQDLISLTPDQMMSSR